MKFKSSEVPTLDDVEVGRHDPNGGREQKTVAVDVFLSLERLWSISGASTRRMRTWRENQS
jgi:hypothetical protein